MFLQVSVCPQGGEGDPPGRETPRQGDPPSKETPLARRPPRQGDPPARRPPARRPPPAKRPPARRPPCQCAGGTHPTGMHSCLENIVTGRYSFNF